MIVEFAGSGHNDVLALLGIVCGLALVQEMAGDRERADCVGRDGESISGGAAAGVDSDARAGRGKTRDGGRRRWREWRHLLVLAPYWNALGMFRAT